MAKFFIVRAFLLVAFVAIAYAAEAEAPTAAKSEITDSDKKKDEKLGKSEVADDLQTAAGGWGFGFPRGGWGGYPAIYNGWGSLYSRPYPVFAGGWGVPAAVFNGGWGWGGAIRGWGWGF